MTVADMFRPAMFVSLAYSKPENQVIDFSSVSGEFRFQRTSFRRFDHHEYGLRRLFWVDGSSCIISILIFTVLVKERKICRFKTAESETEIPVSVLRTRYSGSSSLFVL
jgi:hypothetical protein